MSRIRSIHPALFTDPEFVQVSMTARMLLIGLWTECDDRGVFEWKPLALKMKLFPADTIDMDALLGELVTAERIRHVEQEGKYYGICRNFAKYQRPKNPSYRYPFSPSWAEFVSLKVIDSDSPPPALPQDNPSPPEKSPLMEDGEEEIRVEKKKEPAAPHFEEEFEWFWEPYPKKVDRGHALKAFISARKRGIPVETLVEGAKRYRDKPDRDPKYTKNAQGWLSGECWNDQAAEAPPTPPPISAEEREMRILRDYAEIIVKQKRSPSLDFSNRHRDRLLQLGMVSQQQFIEAGI